MSSKDRFRMRIKHHGFREAFLLLFVMILFCALGLASSPGWASSSGRSDTVPRWMAPYWVEVPASWKPLVDRREGVMFFTGAPPDVAGTPEGENLAIVALGVMRQAPPKGGSYEDFLEFFEQQARKGDARNFTSSREEITLGSSPAVLYTFSGEADFEGTFKKVGGTMVVAKEPDQEGRFTLVMGMGNALGLEEHKDQIRDMLASARKGEPPLKLERSFPYGATSEVFRYTFGLAWSFQGVLALGDSRNCRIRLFDDQGTLLEEWGEKGKGEEGTFSYPQDFAFTPEGSLWVAEEGYSVRARLQHFTQKGELLQKIDLSPKIMGEKGIYKPFFVRVTDSGKIVVSGITEIREGKDRILVFAPSGELLAAWEPGEIGGLAPLPGDRLLLFQKNPESDRNGLFCVYDLEGNKLAQWSFYGTGFAPTPGDEEVYFRPKGLATDEAGNIYVYDDSEDALWVYDTEGRFLQALPVREHFGIFMGMTASPKGDVVVQDRPSSYAPGEPSLHIMKNTLISSLPKPSEPEKEPEPDSKPEPESDSEDLAEKESLREELARLKKALALREQALALEKTGDLEGAVALYRESLPLHPDSAVEAYAAELEKLLQESAIPVKIPKEASEEKEKAPAPQEVPLISEDSQVSLESLLPEPSVAPEPPELPELLEESLLPPSAYEEAEKLEAEGQRYEALLKYQEALRKEPDPAMQSHARELENALRREARQMVAQAVEVQNRGEYPKALELYRKSLTIFPLEQVKDYADRLELLLYQGGQSQEVRVKAESLWREGAALEKNWRYREALVKYKEGLALSPDPKVEEHVKKLEAFLAGRSN